MSNHANLSPSAESLLFPGRESDPDTLEEVVGQAIGAGSACWETLSGAGVFQSERACQILNEAVAWIHTHYVQREDSHV